MTSLQWKDKKVLVTGATGLLGSHLVRALQECEAEVVTLIRDRVPRSYLWSAAEANHFVSVYGELDDYLLLARVMNEYEIEVVFHLGAQSIVPIANRNPLSTFESNIRGTYHLLEACRLASTVQAVIVSSSDKAYGDHHDLPYTETTPLRGQNPYDVSKSCVDLLSSTYHKSFDLPVCVIRLANMFGPGDLNFNRLIPGTIRSILKGEEPIIRSDGTYTRDYIYVEDAALACLLLGEKMILQNIMGEAFNFSNELRISALEMVKTILKLMESSLQPKILNNVTGEIVHQYLSTQKVRSVLGWSPCFPLEEGLRKTIAWYRNFLSESTSRRSCPHK